MNSRFLLGATAALLGACSGGNYLLIGSTAGDLRPTAAFARLQTDLSVASLSLREGDVDRVEVRAEVLVDDGHPAAAQGGDASAQLPFADWIRLEQVGDAVVLGSAVPGSHHELRIQMVVPRGRRALDLHVAVGSIDMAVDAASSIAVRVETGSVRCRADTVDGVVQARSSTGRVDVAIAKKIGGDVDLNVSVGSVVLGLPAAVQGNFDLGVDVGSCSGLSRYGLGEDRSMTGAGTVGSLGGSGPTFRVRVGTGRIELR